MRKYLILFFLASLFWWSCKGDGAPKGLLKPGAMAGLLTEIHIIDGRLYSMVQTPDTLYKYGMGNYLQAFAHFGTDSATFRKSLAYYADYPDKLSAIYDDVDARIKTLSDSLNKLQMKERTAQLKADSANLAHKSDSIKKALQHPLKLAAAADSIKKKAKQAKADSLKKLKKHKRPDALPKK